MAADVEVVVVEVSCVARRVEWSVGVHVAEDSTWVLPSLS